MKNKLQYVLLFAVIFMALLPMVFAETDAPILTITQPKGEYFTYDLPYYNIPINFSYIENNPNVCWYISNNSILNYNNFSTFQSSCTGSITSCNYASDGNWTTAALAGSGFGGTIYENFTLPYIPIFNNYSINYTYKGVVAGFPDNRIDTYCFNISSKSWNIFNSNTDLDAIMKNITLVVPSSCHNSSTTILQIKNNLIATGGGSPQYFYESNISFYIGIINNYLNTTVNISNSGNDNLYLYMSDTFSNIGSSSSNFSINLLNASHWASLGNITSGDTETFNLQINSTNITTITATLYFNDTAYASTSSTNSNKQANISTSVLMPIVSTSRNMPFYWNYTMNSFNNITDKKNITVNPGSLVINETCQLGLSAAFNFTFADEENFSSLRESITYNFKYGFVNNTQFISFGSLSNISSFQLCINASISNNYSLGYGEITYQRSGYTERRYYIMQNQRATNITGNIILYSLENSFATSFLFNAKDSALNPYSNYYLALLRWYPDNDTYRIVEMGKTNDNGQTVMKVHSDIVDYRVALYKIDGTLIKLANASRISCIETPCTYNLVVYGAESDYTSLYNIQSSVIKTYSDTLTFTWNDPSQLTDSMTFYVYQDNGYTETLICNDTSNNYIGVLSCNFSGYSGMIGYKGFRTASPIRPIISGFFELRNRLDSAFGLIIQFCISMILGFIALFSPIAAISMGIVSLVIGWAIGTISFQILVSIAIIGGIIIHFIGRSLGR